MINLNSKGQTLVVFILLLPVVLLFMMVIIEKCYLYIEQQNIKGTFDIVCSYVLEEKNSEKIEKLAYQNDKDLDKVTVTYSESTVTVRLDKNIKSIFGNIVGYSTYSYHIEDTCAN